MKLAGEVAVNGPGRGIGRDRVYAGQGRSEVALVTRTAAEIEAAAQPIRVDRGPPAPMRSIDREAVARAFAAVRPSSGRSAGLTVQIGS